MSTMKSELTDAISDIKKLIHSLHAISPNRFTSKLEQAKTTNEIYAVVLEMGYAANSPELADTSDDQVITVLKELRLQVKNLNSILRIKLWPASDIQKQDWVRFVQMAPNGKYAFRNDGSLEISLLDSKLNDSTLHIKRIWSHVCNFDGSWTEFEIKLDEAQISDFKRKSSKLDN
jgi:hypothetical protein